MSLKKIIDSRRKFVISGAALLSALALWKWSKPAPAVTKKVRMLSEDGELVEVDEAVLAAIRQSTRRGDAIVCNSNTVITADDKIKLKLEGIKNFVRRK
jgi:hypothetical protein